MTPLTVTRNQSGPLSWVSPDDLKEWAYRAKLFEQAKHGDEGALAELRDGPLKLQTLMLGGKLLIENGVLVAAKRIV